MKKKKCTHNWQEYEDFNGNMRVEFRYFTTQHNKKCAKVWHRARFTLWWCKMCYGWEWLTGDDRCLSKKVSFTGKIVDK